MLTMNDEKLFNAATDTASAGQTSKDFNRLIEAEELNIEAVKFALSILYAGIRFFDSLLDLAYKLPLKKWQARIVMLKI